MTTTIEFGQLRVQRKRGFEIYLYGIWRRICYARWDISDSAVACRQLGYRTATEVNINYNYYYIYSDYWIQNVACFGNESKLSDCSYDLGNHCNYYNLVNLNCVSGKCLHYGVRYLYCIHFMNIL